MRLFFTLSLLIIFNSADATDLPLKSLQLPPNFSITLYADSVPNAREMTLSKKGTVFVGSRDAGKVYAIIRDTTQPLGTRVITIASNLNHPNGVAFFQDALYVAENDQLLRYDNIEDHLNSPPRPVLIKKLPTETHHGWRYIRFGPDGKLYIGIGAPCDSCLRKESYFATIMRMDPDGKNFEIYAKGVRNTVGFDWDPNTHQLWFTDNGRDWMGDNIPADELNVVRRMGEHFGFPYCHGTNIPDPFYGKYYPCSKFVKPVLELPAHVAALGMCFYKGNMFPKDYLNQIFIAEHGSWNRSSKVGYQIIAVTLKDDHAIATKNFITGWLQGSRAWGRPVDVLTLLDGSLLISDDYAGVIYRVTYSGK